MQKDKLKAAEVLLSVILDNDTRNPDSNPETKGTRAFTTASLKEELAKAKRRIEEQENNQ